MSTNNDTNQQSGASAQIAGADILTAASKMMEQMMQVTTQQAGFASVEQQADMVRQISRMMAGDDDLTPSPTDKRFNDPLFAQNPFYQAAMQNYILWSKTMDRFVDALGLDDASTKRARFFVNLITDALSPTNTLLGNPAAMKRFVESGGQSTLDGLKNFMSDLIENRGMPAQVDKSKYKVGDNLAITPGSVVFKNEMMEILQYKPQTDQVHAIPVLIVPSMINKYYALDLAPKRSFVEFALQQGLQVFMVSWANPTEDHRDWNFDTYLKAIIDAIEVTRNIADAPQVHLLAVCAGGMLTASVIGHLLDKNQDLVRSSTYVVTMLDNAIEETKLSLFTTQETVDLVKQFTQTTGVFAGNDMANVFAWMRPNDLVWNYWINNYLMGNPPPAFDILYWNNDSTRLPALFHGQLLEVGLRNAFATAGAVSALGTPLDLKKVNCDIYMVAGLTDHICPWKNVYASAQLFGSQVEFVLVGSGHVQSFINPPGNAKAKYYVNAHLPASHDEWFASAEKKPDSFWGHWTDWTKARSGDLVQARSPGNAQYPPLGDAPGQYVLQQ